MYNNIKNLFRANIAFITILFSISNPLNGKEIIVKNQQDLDILTERLISFIKDGTTKIKVKFSSGKYHYPQSIISLSIQNDDLSLFFIGQDVTLVPKYSKAKTFNPSSVQFYGERFESLWSEVVQSPELITIVNKSEKLCRIKIADGITAKSGDYIQISQWYKTLRYKVVSADTDYIYFIADDLFIVNDKSEWSVNYDYIYAKKYPRYRVFSIYSDKDVQQSSVTTFCDISQAKIKELTIKGISFMGSAGSIDSKGVINFSNALAKKINIENCRFIGCRSSCVRLENTSNIKIKDCLFYSNYTTCVYVDTNCNRVSITNNLFEDNGKEWNNSHVVLARGADFVISNNVFRDFCYGAIGVGVWYKHKKTTKVSGIIANNEIYYTKAYYHDYLKHTLMDSGAIYLWTQMDDVTIKHNYIHDISGVEDNRGIFCDDGAKNVKVLENIILHITNSYCIDLREAPYVAELVPDYNIGNQCINNLVDGEIRFFIKNKSCKLYNNKVIGESGWETMSEYKKWYKKLKSMQQ